MKKVASQKISLPEDVEALKVFHKAFLEKEEEVARSKKKIDSLER